MYLLDTNVCIALMLRYGPEARRLASVQIGAVAMSAIVYGELRAGLDRPQLRPDDSARSLAGLVEDVPVLPFDGAAAASYGDLFVRVPKRRNSFDRLIAAHALALGATLVTNDEEDFADVPGLALENWSRP